jgi:hypothetical protein
MEAKRRSLVAIVLSSLLVLVLAGTTMAQPRQEGLVNVIIEDVYVQVPIAVAANVCDVNVNVLARQFRGGGAQCDAEAESGATIPWQGGNGSQQRQEGLVNVLLTDIVVQVPLGVALNICDVNANVLAQQARLGGATCDAVARPVAELGL